MFRILVVMAMLFSGARIASADTEIFFDGDFNEEDWDKVCVQQFSGLGDCKIFTVPSGGNPGAYRQIDIDFPDDFQSTTAYTFSNKIVFDPSTRGRIESVRFELDSRLLLATNGATEYGNGVAVRQGGTRHQVPVAVDRNEAWHEAIDIEDIVPGLPTVNWNDGGLIEFGFYNYGSSSKEVDGGVGDYQLKAGYDNVKVTIEFTPVPEPATMTQGIVCILSGTWLIWRRSRHVRRHQGRPSICKDIDDPTV